MNVQAQAHCLLIRCHPNTCAHIATHPLARRISTFLLGIQKYDTRDISCIRTACVQVHTTVFQGNKNGVYSFQQTPSKSHVL